MGTSKERSILPTWLLELSGGLSNEELVPRVFFTYAGGTAQQLSLFEAAGDYEAREMLPFEVD